MKPTPPKTPKHTRANISLPASENKDQEKDALQDENDKNDLNLDDEDNLELFASPRSFRGHTIKLEQFGSYSPSWTIGSSRRAPRPKDEAPGPTDYDISNYNTMSSIASRTRKKQENNLNRSTTSRNLNRTISKNSFTRSNLTSTAISNYSNAYSSNTSSRSPRNNTNQSSRGDALKNYRTITSDIDFVNMNDYYSTFGDLKRSRSIGIRKDTIFWTPTQSPPVMYELNSSLSPRNIRIGKRIQEKIEEKPGPGDYDPSLDYTRVDDNKKLLTISKSSEREVFHIERNKSPGPGQYEVIKLPRKPPTWFKERRITKPPNEHDGSSYASSRVSYR